MTTRDVAQVISDGAERICQSIDRLQPPLPPTTVDQRLTVIAVIDLLQDEDTETLCHRTDSLIGRPRWCHRLASRAERIHPPPLPPGAWPPTYPASTAMRILT